MKQSLFCIAIAVAFANCSILLEPGYKQVIRTWDEVIGMTKQEAEQYLTSKFPGVAFRHFFEEDLPEEFYFNKIKLVFNASFHVVETPKFFGHEPDFEKLGDLVGKNHSEALEILRTVVKEEIVINLENGEDFLISEDKGSSSNNYVILLLGLDLNVVEPPIYIRVLPLHEFPVSTRKTTQAEENTDEGAEGSAAEGQANLPDSE